MSDVIFYHGTEDDKTEVMRLTRDKVILNPELTVEDAARRVIEVLQDYIRHVVFHAVADEREQCAADVAELVALLSKAEDLLAAYIETLSNQGAMLSYGNSLLSEMKAALAKWEGK